jgi:3-oxoadipate enol-lactonase
LGERAWAFRLRGEVDGVMNQVLDIAEQRWVMNGDVQLALESYGTGAIPVVFAHGWISSRRMWYECIQLLDLERYQAHVFDFRGCGRSDRTPDGHDLEGYASDLVAVLRQIAKPCILVGHSMGGRLAQRVAVDRMPEIAALVLVAPGMAVSASVVPRQRQLAELAWGSRRRITSFQRGAMKAQVSEQAAECLVEDALLAQREHWFGWYDHGRVSDFSNLLENITVPTNVVIAQEDPLVPPSRILRDVVEKITGAQSVILESCGHNVPIEMPSAVARAIEEVDLRRK